MRRTPFLAAVGGLALLIARTDALGAQPGNLLTNGRIDTGVGITGWTRTNTELSTLAIDGDDADACAGSDSAAISSMTTVDFGGMDFRTCVTSFDPEALYRVEGEFLFPSSAVAGRANVLINFTSHANCSGSYVGDGTTTPNAEPAVGGWQFRRSPAIPVPEGAASILVSVLLVKYEGTDPDLLARFDNVRLVEDAWIFAEDHEIGEACRWAAVDPD